jgi:phosphoribosylglycinamide formyltransferase 1
MRGEGLGGSAPGSLNGEGGHVRIAVFASHEGTTLQALIDACAGEQSVELALVVSNNRSSRALERARMAGVPTACLSGRTHPIAGELDAAIRAALLANEIDLVVLAGYMKKLGPRTLSEFEGRILNSHPALLPKFGGRGMFGLHVHRAVLEAGVNMTGASVHVVTEEYDAGPVIAQREVAVRPDDSPESLAERVQVVERDLLVEVVRDVASGRLTLEDSRV